jgi:outer membrane protein assembly factor BamB
MSHRDLKFRPAKLFSKASVLSFICLIGLASVYSCAWADDWPAYMHDNARTGVTAETLILEDLNQAWIYQSPAPPMRAWSDGPQWDAWSTNGAVPMRDFDTAFFVTVVDDNVYFGSSVTNSVHCLDVLTGEQKWFYRTDGPVRFPPTCYNGKLYFGSDDGYLYCINASDGSFVFKYSPSSDQRIIMNNANLITMWPIRTGTAVLDGKVYFAASLVPWQGTYLCALDAETGSDSGTGLYSTSGGIAPNGAILASSDYLYLPQGRYYPQVFNRLTGVSAGTMSGVAGSFALLTFDGPSTGFVYGSGKFSSYGGELRGHNDKIATYANGKYLVVAHDTSYVITETFSIEANKGYKYNYITKLRALDRNDGGSSKWSADFTCDTRRFAMILAGDTLFTGGVGKVQAHSTTDGSVLWSAPVNGRARGLAAADGKLFVSTDTGYIYMFGSSFLPADFDKSGTVDILDLLIFISEYFKCTNPNDPACQNLLD